MPLILYAQLVFGNLFVIRTLQIFRARALLSQSLVTKTGTSFVCASILATFFCMHAPILCSGLITGAVFLTTVALFFAERRKISALKAEIPIFFDCWILNLRLGLALSAARDAALREQRESFQSLMRPVFTAQSGNLKRQHLLLSRALLEEVENLAREPHSALSRLENLRAMLRKSAEFRRKSGQATRQTTIQAAVMVVLLVALITFTLSRYGWRKSGDLVSLSFGLSLLGITTMCWIARKSKWKI